MPGGYIQTFGEKQFYPLQPNPDDIDIVDIAHSLALQCRFNGHCKKFYSVAEHSVRCSLLLAEKGCDLSLWALLHDAAEAYVGDLPRPVKEQMPQFREIEDALLEVIIKHFGLSWPMPPAVKHADDTLLLTEARDLMNMRWDLGEGLSPLPETITPVESERAKAMFLERFAELR